MKNFTKFIILFIFITTVGCLEETDLPELSTFPITPINVDVINTEYDEYSSAISGYLNGAISFQISSNENSNGDDLDILNYFLSFNQPYLNSDLAYSLNKDGYNYFDSALFVINSSFNEFSPFINYTQDHSSDIFFFTSNETGNNDIYYSKGDYTENIWTNPESISKINTENNEKDIIILYQELMYCSDETGNYDIYRIDLSNFSSLMDWVTSENVLEKENFEILNSPYDDINPYLSGNFIYFSSNRLDGYGGYDIYYSHYENGNWSEPINCGEKINSQYDELNPLVVYYLNYKNDLLFFTSNKPGGSGGYDIYSAGVQKVTN